MSPKKKKQTEQTFEESVRRLEEIVASLEEGTVSLDEALELYEEGITLSKQCAERIKAAELRVRKLSKNAPDTDE